MRVDIEYDSCWQASILDKEEKSKKNKFRKFNKSGENRREITDDTILGVLYRLIGDQRTLKNIKESSNAFFSDIHIRFNRTKTIDYEELVMLINKSNDRCSDGKYIGVPYDDNDLFFSPYAPDLWSVLSLDIVNVMEFIINPKLISGKSCSAMPRDIMERIDKIQNLNPLEIIEYLVDKEKFKQKKQEDALKKMLTEDSKASQKSINNKKNTVQKITETINSIRSDKGLIKLTHAINETLKALKVYFPDIPAEDYIKKGGEVKPIRFYCAALYLQAELLESSGKNIESFYILQKKGINKGKKTIQGFSKKGFNGVRDFLNPLSTGGNKKAVKTPFELTKASGQIEIEILVDKMKGKEIKSMIENAGVSSFYLGKKGLAYVSKIRV